VRTLCAGGSYALAEEFLEQISAESRTVDVLLKAAQGFQSAGRHDAAVRWAKVALERDATNASALIIVGDCLRVLAEQGARGWDRDKVREALRAYRAVHRQQEKNLIVVNNIVWLELKALELPQQAFESAAPLRAVQDAVSLPADFMDTLGEVYSAVGRFEDSKKLHEQAIQTAGPRASFYMHLALAHDGLGQPELAEKCLNQAAELPKTQRETAELYDVAQRIQRRR
jgi:tetratricopeptide (TPR) repeat protein